MIKKTGFGLVSDTSWNLIALSSHSICFFRHSESSSDSNVGKVIFKLMIVLYEIKMAPYHSLRNRRYAENRQRRYCHENQKTHSSLSILCQVLYA